MTAVQILWPPLGTGIPNRAEPLEAENVDVNRPEVMFVLSWNRGVSVFRTWGHKERLLLLQSSLLSSVAVFLFSPNAAGLLSLFSLEDFSLLPVGCLLCSPTAVPLFSKVDSVSLFLVFYFDEGSIVCLDGFVLLKLGKRRSVESLCSVLQTTFIIYNQCF